MILSFGENLREIKKRWGREDLSSLPPFAWWLLSIRKHTGSDAGGFGSGDGELVCIDISCGVWACVAQLCSSGNHIHTV